MNRTGRKSGKADGDVFSSARMWRTITDSFTLLDNDGLTRINKECGFICFDLELAIEDNGIFVEFICLKGADQSVGLVILAMLSVEVFEFTKPINTSMIP